MNIGISIYILQILIGVSCFKGQLNPIKSNNGTILAETIIGKTESEYSPFKHCGTDCIYTPGRTIGTIEIRKKFSWKVYNTFCPGGIDVFEALNEYPGTLKACKFLSTGTRFYAHGFKSGPGTSTDSCPDFLEAYQGVRGFSRGLIQFVCIDWSAIAKLKISNKLAHLGVYDEQAKMAIDVGQWLGFWLHDLSQTTNLPGSDIRLIGHSLGAHLMGMAARTFEGLGQNGKIGHLMGLDPAGPVFVQNEWGLKHHMIKKTDATWVQIIHTNGGFDPHVNILTKTRLGDLHQLGDIDFYVNGGSLQPCYTPGKQGWEELKKCSHMKAIDYYINSIHRPHRYKQGRQCETAKKCNEEILVKDGKQNHMGEWADVNKNGLYEINIECWPKGAKCIMGTNCFKCCDDWHHARWYHFRGTCN